MQAQHLRSLGSHRTASVWARGLTRQLWKVAFRMWQHRNGWQHSEDNPQNLLLRQTLDSQISDALEQGSDSVRAEHRHLFTMSLENRLKGLILDKQNWLEFVDMAQRKAIAHRRRHQESKRRFRAWARSGLSDPGSPPAKRPRSTQGRLPTKRLRSEAVQPRPSGQKRRKPDSAAVSSRWSGCKRECPPDTSPA